MSKGRPKSKQVKQIESAIVDGYKRGVCDHNGNTIPLHKRSSNYGGSHFSRNLIPNDKYRENYVRAFGHG
jgi:hypothetical protein